MVIDSYRCFYICFLYNHIYKCPIQVFSSALHKHAWHEHNLCMWASVLLSKNCWDRVQCNLLKQLVHHNMPQASGASMLSLPLLHASVGASIYLAGMSGYNTSKPSTLSASGKLVHGLSQICTRRQWMCKRVWKWASGKLEKVSLEKSFEKLLVVVTG